MQMTLDRVRGGRLPLPFDAIMDRAAARIDPANSKKMRSFQKLREQLQALPLTFELGDGRIVDVLDVDLQQGIMTLTCRTRLK
jgi:hypothetical protein